MGLLELCCICCHPYRGHSHVSPGALRAYVEGFAMRSEDILDNPCALQIVLYISECIDAGDPAPRVKDIAKQCYISRGHVSRLVKQLAAQKYVIKAGRRWRGLDIPVRTVEAMRNKGYEIMKVTRERHAAAPFQLTETPQPEESVRGASRVISGSQLRLHLRNLAQSDALQNARKDMDLMLASQQRASAALERAMASRMVAMETEAKKDAQRLALQSVTSEMAKSAALELSKISTARAALVEAGKAASLEVARILEAMKPSIAQDFAAMNAALVEAGKASLLEAAQSAAAISEVKRLALSLEQASEIRAAALYSSIR